MMVVYPALSSEEKALRKRYARLAEKRKQLLKKQDQSSTSLAGKQQAHRDAVTPKDAKEAAKQLLEAGKLMIQKKSPLRRTGFKRVGEKPNEGPPSKKSNISTTVDDKIPTRPKIKAEDVKEVYKRTLAASFVPASTADDLERIPKKDPASSAQSKLVKQQFSTQECTVYVKSIGIGEEPLRCAFSKYWEIQTLMLDPTKSTSFITFKNPGIVETVVKEMNGGMIRGSDVIVERASKDNGFIELSEDASKNPWAVMSAGRTVSDTPRKVRHKKEVLSYEPNF